MTQAPRRRRHPLRLLAVAAAALVAGMLPGSGDRVAAEEQRARVSMAYACGSAGEATAEVAASFPESGAVGRPIQPGEVTLTVSLEAAELLPEGTHAVAGTAALTARVAQGEETAEARWADLTAEPAVPPGEGPVELTYTGPVPPVTVGAPGDVTFTAADLALTLAPQPESPPVRLDCTPAEDAGTLLATVPVPDPAAEDGGQPPAASSSPEGDAGDEGDAPPPIAVDEPRAAKETGPCPAGPPSGELDEDRLPEPPRDAAVEEMEPVSACAVPAGFASVAKLDGSMIVNDPRAEPAPMHIGLMARTVSAPDYIELDSVGVLAFPDAESTFLTFGFQPTSAEVSFEARPATIANVNDHGTMTTYVGYEQYLRLHDVRVNGTPLDVGPSCRTARPVDTRLSGEYDFLEGGLLEGTLDIPPFSGCGTGGEDLDPLFTAAISGPGNHVRIRQGPVCQAGQKCTVPELPDLG